VSNANDKNELTSSMIKFCIGKERINFCSDEHLHMMINFAALHGKSRPINDLSELESERQKAIEKQRISNMEQEKKRLKLIELKKERQRQIDLISKKKKEEERLRKILIEEKIMKHIINSFNEKKNERILFRF
jgi:hypothetical protein